METEDRVAKMYVRSLDATLASRIRQAKDTASLRRYACQVARMGLRNTSAELPPDLLSALEVAERHVAGEESDASLEAANRRAEHAEDELADRAALSAQLGEKGEITDDEHYKAGASAMVGWAIVACTSPSARGAAAWASYEVYSAISREQFTEEQVVEELLQLSESLA